MKRLLVVVGLALALVGVLGAAQHFYAFYYDLSDGQDLTVNLINTMGSDSDYALRVYDAWGSLLWEKPGDLASYEADFYTLSDYVPSGDWSWGVVTVESDELLVIGLEYMADGAVVSVDTIAQEVPTLEEGTPYWLGAYYTQAGGLSTGVIVMNPWDQPVSVSVTLYNPKGEELYSQDIELAPHESEYLDLDKAVGQGGLIWGLVDVQMLGKAVIVALEYYGEGLEIDNITEYYF